MFWNLLDTSFIFSSLIKLNARFSEKKVCLIKEAMLSVRVRDLINFQVEDTVLNSIIKLL